MASICAWAVAAGSRVRRSVGTQGGLITELGYREIYFRSSDLGSGTVATTQKEVPSNLASPIPALCGLR